MDHHNVFRNMRMRIALRRFAVRLRALLQSRGYVFVTETDTEVIAHLVHWELEQGGTLRITSGLPERAASRVPGSRVSMITVP
jgi:glutamine phosphoribosylpyrophosphate amidotransferase